MARTALAAVALAGLVPAPAWGHGLAMADGTLAGLAHPLGGWDHLAAMVSVGLVSTRLGRWAVGYVPAAFLAALVLGGAAGVAGVALPPTEGLVVGSVAGLGAVILLRTRVPAWAAVAMVAAFGFAHGRAHGLEIPHLANPVWFTAGFVTASAALHLAGIFLGAIIENGRRPRLAFHLLGAALLLAGTVGLLALP